MIAVMVISQPPGNNPSLLSLHQRCLNCSEGFRDTLMFYTCNYNIRVFIEMVLLSIFLHESDPRRDHHRMFFIHFVAPCACSSSKAVKILLQIFLYEDLEHVGLTYICRLYFLQNASRTALCYATNTIK